MCSGIMSILSSKLIIFCVLQSISKCQCEFVIPKASIEAFKPKGFRVFIPDEEGIQLVGFHGNLNNFINPIEPGEFDEDITRPTGNQWIYENKDETLKVGDKIHYWMFVQYNNLGYKRLDEVLEVKELIDPNEKPVEKPCKLTPTIVEGNTKQLCAKQLLFADDFDENKVNTRRWTLEQYLPVLTGPDSEFVSYQKKALSQHQGKLSITPLLGKRNVVIDLKDGCTRPEKACKQDNTIITRFNAGIVSGRIISNFKFAFGKIEIKAKLPVGDWIYPQIYLESVRNQTQKIFIAYCRGNRDLKAADGSDIGGRLLFGGPVLDQVEPGRSSHLLSKRNAEPFANDFHAYKVIWNKDKILMYLDGQLYGTVNPRSIGFPDNDMFRLVLGVGVGGNTDFPDDFTSNGIVKPWKNYQINSIEQFYQQKDVWLQTWLEPALQVESVKIWAAER